jgi:hypothetical protein
MTRSASIKSTILAIRTSLLKILKNDQAFSSSLHKLLLIGAANDAHADLAMLEKLIDPKQVMVQNRIDIFTDDGLYLHSVCKGGDDKWRIVHFYINAEGQEAIMNIQMTSPDWTNMARMNI